MTNEEILKKVIEKAVRNHWNNPFEFAYYGDGKSHVYGQDLLDFVRRIIREKRYYSIIFFLSFAKAFWHYKEYWRSKDDKECWRYHQHQMLDYIQEGKNPLKYLEQFLE